MSAHDCSALEMRNKAFDAVVSLGGSCSVAMQLRHRGKRPCSLPLDWMLMTDTRPIESLCRLFSTRFAGFLDWADVEEFEPPRMELGQPTYRILDKRSGFRLVHHFRGASFDRASFDTGKRMVLRRIERLYGKIESSKRVLFVLSTFFAYDLELAERLLVVLQETFRRQDVRMVVMQFAASANDEEYRCGGRMHVMRFQRRGSNAYDNRLTAPEWGWMDELRIVGMPSPESVRKKRFLVKAGYKIWRRIGRWLRDSGAGVDCMRFDDFSEQMGAEERA